MTARDTVTAFALSLFGGLLLWTLMLYLGHQREPWDAPVYWTLGYPLAILFSAILGALYPERPYRWALVVIFAQLLVMIARGSDFSLLPLGLLLLGLLSLPTVAAAFLAAWLRTGLLTRRG